MVAARLPNAPLLAAQLSTAATAGGVGLALAEGLEQRIREDEDLKLVTSGRLGLVCFRPVREELGPAILDHVNGSGEAYMTHTKVGEHFTLRWHTAQDLTTEEDVDAGWSALRSAIDAMPKE